MRYAALYLLALLLSCNNAGSNSEAACETAMQKVAADTSAECQAQRAVALSDHNSGSMKYYFYGIAHPSKEAVRKLEELNIAVVVKGCAPEKAKLCYNQFIDSIMLSEYRVDVSAIR